MVSVTVYKRSGRPFWTARWVDQLTGKRCERTTKCTTRRAAERYAAQLESELAAGGGRGPLPWAEFRTAYFREYVARLRTSTKQKVASTFNLIENLIDPRRADFTSRDVGRFAAALREPYLGQDGETLRTRSEGTVRCHLVNLQTALRWAKRQKLIGHLPDFNLPPKPGSARGRAITAEELDRLLDATPLEVGDQAADEWRFLILGLWWGGLRLSEAIKLSWADQGTGMQVDLSGRHPVFLVSAAAEKGKRDRVLPMAPEFSELLDQVPERRRRGFVFHPLHRNGRAVSRRKDWVSRTLRQIGARAGVVVRTNPDGSQATAGAQSLRRSFGTRWAARVLPPVLQELMRHQDIKTTMGFYVSQQAQTTASTIWAAYRSSTEASEPEPKKIPDSV